MRRRLLLVLVTASLILGGWAIFRPARSASAARDDAIVLDQPVSVPPVRARPVGVRPLARDVWEGINAKFLPNRRVPEVSFLLHHLINWGREARFAEGTGAASGATLLAILVDGRSDPLFTPKSPLLYRDPDGRTQLARHRESGSEGHPHQVLASFAALNLPGSQVLRSGSVTTTIAELVKSARSDFHLQGEVEWTAVALALYAPTPRRWSNRWGRSFDFDAIADHLLTQPLGEGTCAGTHRLQTLTILLRVDAQRRIISDGVRAQIRRRLDEAINLLKVNQRSSGCWTPDWPHPLNDPDDEKYDEQFFQPIDLVQATGHHLEWLDLVPLDRTVDDRMRARAIEWCASALIRTRSVEDDSLCPYSHCFRMARRLLTPTIEETGKDGMR